MLTTWNVAYNRKSNFLMNQNCSHQQRPTKLRQQQQYRFMGRYGGGTQAEEHFISTAFKKLDTKNPRLVVHCERVQLVGCNLLPRQAQKILQDATIRFRVITHADTVSLDVLKHQIAFVEEQERRNYPNSKYPTAVFAMNLSTAASSREKQMKSFADAIFGASSLLPGKSPILVCGIPNSGKSSLVLALTRQRTLKVKNKKEYHLPKVSTQAGRTLGTKTHVLEFNKDYVSFMDSPGLRPRLEGLDPGTIRLLLASKSVEPFKGYIKYISDQVLIRLLLQAANNYTNINYAIGKVLHERKMSTSKRVVEYASPTLPDYATAFGLSDRTEDPDVFIDAYYKTSTEQKSNDPLYLVRKFQSGDFGSWLFTPYRQDVLSVGNIEAMRPFNQNHEPILYCNQAAYGYIGKAPEFGAQKKSLRKARDIERQMNAKAESSKNNTTLTGPDDSKKSVTKKVFNEKEMDYLENVWS